MLRLSLAVFGVASWLGVLIDRGIYEHLYVLQRDERVGFTWESG